MGAISALRTTGGALSRNRVIFVATFIVALFSVLALSLWFAAQILFEPLVSLLAILLGSVVFFFIPPFLVGGILGMASEAVSGMTSLGTFVRVGKARYVTLLLANLLYGVLVFALYIVFFIIGAIAALVVFGVAFASSGGGGGHIGITAIVVFVLVVLILYLLFFLFIFFVQFFSVAVVVDEAGVTESFSRSYRLVRQNLLSTLGYMLLRFVVAIAILIPSAIVLGLVVFATGGLPTPPMTSPQAPGAPPFGGGFDISTAVLAAFAIGFLVLQTILSAVMTTYAVAFYRDRRAPDRDESEPENAQGPNQQPGD